MYMDDNLKCEVISSLLGQGVKPYAGSRWSANNLSVNDFFLSTTLGKTGCTLKAPFLKTSEFFDPQYDHDFTNLSGSAECKRGDEVYVRPKGWYRIALKVKGKYPGGDAWLGSNGWRSHSDPGEWPVSYHGTSVDGADGIIKSHYKAGDRAMYGRGIYSTPDIHIAEKEDYAKTFESQTTGKKYKVILQNRINPKMREICQRSDYWLVRIDKVTSARKEKQIVESAIRPYGILVKELKDDDDDKNNKDDDGDENPNVSGAFSLLSLAKSLLGW
ncbi:uncharacterized protein LOC117502502 [Thalassophryne amazonica]|uniref:uncharacterized protein LOC117502502 n=1 Tax=Thalassophryne amazonica TaxID=390379 RepID=UPI00147122C5|nr:uncharacterized protein LOC117502502 [Thalassophryne amazonica]